MKKLDMDMEIEGVLYCVTVAYTDHTEYCIENIEQYPEEWNGVPPMIELSEARFEELNKFLMCDDNFNDKVGEQIILKNEGGS
jgi:hypothetical protein